MFSAHLTPSRSPARRVAMPALSASGSKLLHSLEASHSPEARRGKSSASVFIAEAFKPLARPEYETSESPQRRTPAATVFDANAPTISNPSPPFFVEAATPKAPYV